MFNWDQSDDKLMEKELSNISLAANYFLRAWYFGDNSKIEVKIFGSQVYIESEDFEYLMIDLKAWIFALKCEEAFITIYSYKSYSDSLIKIIEKIEKSMINNFTKKDLKNIIDSVKPKDLKKMN